MQKIKKTEISLDNRSWSQNLISDKEHISIEQHIYSEASTGFHFHTYYEFELVISGEAEVMIENQIIALQQFDYYIIPPEQIHKIFVKERPTVFLDILFGTELLDNSVLNILQCTENPIIGKMPDKLIQYMGESIDLYKEAEQKIESIGMYKRMLYNAIENILIYVLNNCKNKDSVLKCNGAYHNDTFIEIVKYVNTHYTQNITNKELSKKFGITPNYMGKRFEKITGKKVSSYVNDLRLGLTYRQLCMTEKTIDEIARNAGFESIAYFYNLFKKKYNLTPRQVREKNKERDM